MADNFAIAGDAFAADRTASKVYGIDVSEPNATVVHSDQDELLESKCNQVSFVKTEPMAATLRNLLAVCESYIAYSVKKNLIRVIHTVSAQKTLLRDHEYPVLDLKFSPVDRNLVCSVDDAPEGADASLARIIMWQLQDGDADLKSERVCMFGFGAAMVQPHPHLASVWAVAKGDRLGIVSFALAQGVAGEHVFKSFDALPLHTSFPGATITGLSFSEDGQCVAVSLVVNASSGVAVWNLPPFDALSSGRGSLERAPCWTQFSNSVGLSSLVFLSQGILTVSRVGGYSTATKDVLLQLFPFTPSNMLATSTPVQSIRVCFPVHPNAAASGSATAADGDLDIALNNGCGKEPKFVVLHHRKSHLVACLAVNRGTWSRQAIYHVTFVDLKWPIFSLDCTTIAGRDHHSDEEVEHLEVSCFQVQDSAQSAIHQYHIPTVSLCNPNAYIPPATTTFSADLGGIGINADLTGLLPMCGSSSGSNGSGQSILSMLNAESAPVPVTPPPAPTGNAQGSSLLSMLNASAALAPDATKSTFVSASPIQRPLSAPPVDDAQPPLPDILPTGSSVQGRSIMSMLNKKVAPPPPLGAGKAPEAAATPVVSIPAPAPAPVAAAVTPAPAAEPAAAGGFSVLGLLLSGLQKQGPAPAEAVEAVPPPAPAAAPVAAVAAPLPLPVPVPAPVPAEVAPPATAVQAPAAVAKTPLNTLQSPSSNHAAAPAASSLESQQQLGDITRSVRASLEVMAEMRAEMTSLRAEVAQLRKAPASASASAPAGAAASVDAIKGVVEAEVKRGVEAALRSKPWRDDFVAQVTQAVSTEVGPALAQKTRDAVKDVVRDTVKAALASSFLKAFESSLLPAFQAGTDRMFAQVQASFDHGMEGLAEQARRSQEYSDECAKCTIDLSREVAALRATVAGLEAKVGDLAAAGTAAGGDGAAAAGAGAGLSDPFSLFEKGKLVESVECALEWKDSDKLVALLERMTPNQFLGKCNRLLQLCTAQQLANDLAVKDPQEGLSKRLEWLKNLVMGLLFASADASTTDPSANQYLGQVMAGMTDSLHKTEARLNEKIAEARSAGDTQQHAAYTAAETDLRMLMVLVSSKS